MDTIEQIKPLVVKLSSPVRCGDWHDAPLKWNVVWGNKNQMFRTKKDAERYARIWKRLGKADEIGAINEFQRINP